MAITFDVCDAQPNRGLLPALDRAAAVAMLLGAPTTEQPAEEARFNPRRPTGRRVEQAYASGARMVAATDRNALALAAHDAFYGHYPLVLSPDAIWLTIAQGFAHHVSLNAESLRHRFVKHEGKAKLQVHREDFVLGQVNPWPEVFAELSSQIREHVDKLADLVVADFSTTGPVERAASEVLLMDTFQAYFEYVMTLGCGIPSITLSGTAADWRSVRRRTATLSEFGLEWWTDALLPVLDELVRTAEGTVDRAFWRSFFRYESGSGPAELTGWIHALFPYLVGQAQTRALVPNRYLAGWREHFAHAERRPPDAFADPPQGPSISALPGSLAGAPVRLIDLRDGSETRLRFVAGLFGVVQDPTTLALSPEAGWAVVRDPDGA